MEGGGDGGDKVRGRSTMTAILLQNDRLPCDSLWIPTSSSATLHGAKSLVNFENVGAEIVAERPFFQQLVKEENGDEDYDACINHRGKKRRLSPTQVHFLEKTFGVENKLEPEKKMQIAKELGLQPRQVAIWFQNRRARFKNKQLEKDYDSLRACYDKLMADYDNLIKEKENLRTEVLSLKEKLLSREKRTENLEPFDATINSPKAELEPTPNAAIENVSNVEPIVKPKPEDASSAKSDVSDSDSPNSFLEPADSSRVFEPDQSDFSQDEEENLSRSFLQPSYYPKLYHDLPAWSCNFGFPEEDQPFWSWAY